MAIFTSVTADQLAVWLRRYAVGTLESLEGIAEGAENSNFFVGTRHGRYVLTLFERLGRDELPFYVHLMVHLARHGIPCPAPLADKDHEYIGSLNGKPAVLMTRMPGASVAAPRIAECATIGAVLAHVHLASQGYNRRLDNPRGIRWWRETAPKVTPFLNHADQAMLKEELRFQTLQRHDELPKGVIHADLFRDNVLFDGGRVGGVLDFYFACVDCQLLDLAVTANDWCVDWMGELMPERVKALLAAYHEVRPLTQPERRAWPALLRAAALRFWLSRLHDFHLPRQGELPTTRDPDRYRDILHLRVAAADNAPWM